MSLLVYAKSITKLVIHSAIYDGLNFNTLRFFLISKKKLCLNIKYFENQKIFSHSKSIPLGILEIPLKPERTACICYTLSCGFVLPRSFQSVGNNLMRKDASIAYCVISLYDSATCSIFI